jgi:hypothetical protein
MNRGWFKLWRKLGDSDLWLSEKFTRGQAWVDLLMLSNHKPGFIRKRGVKVDIDRGQLGWSEVRLAERWKWSRGKARRFLSELASGNDPYIVQQKTKITTLITIRNFNTYQSSSTTNETTDSTTDSTIDGHQTDIKQYSNKNVKNVKNEKNTYTPTSDEVRLSELLLDKIINEFPTHRFIKNPPSIQSWAKHIDLMLRRDGRSVEQIEYVVNWLYGDNMTGEITFEVQGTQSLRKKFDKIVSHLTRNRKGVSHSKQDKAMKGTLDNMDAWLKKKGEEG